jgi:small subunit ribosomal protein S1
VPQPFQILKMDRRRGNIVVSRRAILEETRAEQRSGLIQSLAEGQVIDGVVKNITDYGAFVDLGGIDGLLHVTDISYKRVNHPSEVLGIGDTVKVQIIRINRETQRISLGMKQLESDPWEGASAKYPVGGVFRGRVTNITEYGAFVELEAGIEGLVHVSEMSWTKKNVHPGKIVSTSQEVDVAVIEVDEEKRRISLGLKQAQENPWEAFASAHPVGSVVEGEVKNATEFGLFIGLDGDVDGMVHMSDIAWGVSGEDALQLHRKGETVKAQVLDVDVEKERISLGMKQLEGGGAGAGTSSGAGAGGSAAGGVKKGDVVTVTVRAVQDAGLDVQVGDDGAIGFAKRGDLGRDRDEQRAERFQVGQKFDAMVVGFDRSKKPNFSIKAMQIAEEKQAVAQYGSSDSGASLGDILGAALKEAQSAKSDKAEKGETGEESEKAEKAPKKSKK